MLVLNLPQDKGWQIPSKIAILKCCLLRAASLPGLYTIQLLPPTMAADARVLSGWPPFWHGGTCVPTAKICAKALSNEVFVPQPSDWKELGFCGNIYENLHTMWSYAMVQAYLPGFLLFLSLWFDIVKLLASVSVYNLNLIFAAFCDWKIAFDQSMSCVVLSRKWRHLLPVDTARYSISGSAAQLSQKGRETPSHNITSSNGWCVKLHTSLTKSAFCVLVC